MVEKNEQSFRNSLTNEFDKFLVYVYEKYLEVK